MTLSREAEEGEPTRPSYIPENAPWAYVTDGLGRKVGAWVSHGGTAVCIDDPDGGHWTYNERLAPTFNGQAYRKLTPALASQCAALLRGEIGRGHKAGSKSSALSAVVMEQSND